MRILALSSVLFLAGCGATISSGDTSSETGGSSTDTSAGLPQCSWPADLDPPVDAGPAWSVGRTYLQCQDGSATELCVSDNLTSCPGTNPVVGATPGPCVDLCKVDEYAVYSGGPPIFMPDGGVGYALMPNLPASCRQVGFNPGGWGTSCCPCE
jgi:hypothetical protein